MLSNFIYFTVTAMKLTQTSSSSPYWEATVTSYAIRHIYWYPKANYHGHNSTPLFSQINPVHFRSYLRWILILPSTSTPRYSKLSLSFRFPHKTRYAPFPLPICGTYTTHLFSSWLARPNNICRAVHVIKLLLIQSPPLLCCLFPRGQKSSTAPAPHSR